jgi:hypothetical protein
MHKRIALKGILKFTLTLGTGIKSLRAWLPAGVFFTGDLNFKLLTLGKKIISHILFLQI